MRIYGKRPDPTTNIVLKAMLKMLGFGGGSAKLAVHEKDSFCFQSFPEA